MKSDKTMAQTSVKGLDRREFLAGAGLVAGASVLAGGAPLPALTGHSPAATGARHTPRRAVFQQMPYFSHDGTGEAYDRPTKSSATGDYLERIGQEEFLRRHWFT